MIEVFYEKYWSDKNTYHLKKEFADLQAVQDCIFNQMAQDYTHMSIPFEDKITTFRGELPFAIRFSPSPEYNGPEYAIHMMKRNGRIIFSDGRMTNNQKHWSKEAKEWCAACRKRQTNPEFDFEESEEENDGEEAYSRNMEEYLSSLSSYEKALLYRQLWFDHVLEDVEMFLDENECNLSEETAKKIARAYVYDGRYDCNLSYWSNIENLVNEFAVKS